MPHGTAQYAIGSNPHTQTNAVLKSQPLTYTTYPYIKPKTVWTFCEGYNNNKEELFIFM